MTFSGHKIVLNRTPIQSIDTMAKITKEWAQSTTLHFVLSAFEEKYGISMDKAHSYRGFAFVTDNLDKKEVKNMLKSLPVSEIADETFENLMVQGLDIIRTSWEYNNKFVETEIRRLIRAVNVREDLREQYIQRFSQKAYDWFHTEED